MEVGFIAICCIGKNCVENLIQATFEVDHQQRSVYSNNWGKNKCVVVQESFGQVMDDDSDHLFLKINSPKVIIISHVITL